MPHDPYTTVTGLAPGPPPRRGCGSLPSGLCRGCGGHPSGFRRGCGSQRDCGSHLSGAQRFIHSGLHRVELVVSGDLLVDARRLRTR